MPVQIKLCTCKSVVSDNQRMKKNNKTKLYARLKQNKHTHDDRDTDN